MLQHLISKKYFLLIAVLLGVLIFNKTTFAQEDAVLQILPAIVDINAQPSTKKSVKIKLTNKSKNPLAVSVSPGNLSPNDETIDPDALSNYDASKWLDISVKNLLIDSSSTIEYTLNIVVPENAVPGGHYSLAVFRILNQTDLDSSGVIVHPEIGAVMLITVPGDTIDRLEISNIKSNKFLFGKPIEFTQEIKNIGNIHQTPIIKTIIKNSRGKVVHTETQPIQLLFPNNKRTINIKWENHNNFEKYYATTEVAYGTPNQLIQSQTNIYYSLPPIWFFVLISGVIVLILRFLYAHSSRFRNIFVTLRKKIVFVFRIPKK